MTDLRDELFKAIQNKDLVALKAALDKGADVGCTDKFGRTPFYHVMMAESIEMMELLLRYVKVNKVK